jgi:hypothetical protein
MTYSERLEQTYDSDSDAPRDLHRHPEARRLYFEALERLRAHLLQTLYQLALVAKIDFPIIPENLRLKNWDSSRYVLPAATKKA